MVINGPGAVCNCGHTQQDHCGCGCSCLYVEPEEKQRAIKALESGTGDGTVRIGCFCPGFTTVPPS